MPQRFLRPGITNSPLWNAVDHTVGSLFIRLLTIVDDYGRTDGRTSVIQGQCFSVWNELNPKKAVKLQQVAALLAELMRIGMIDVYDTDGKRVLQINQWQERIREGAKEKWPRKPESAALCCDLLPPTPSSPPSPAPAIVRHCSNGSQANTSEPAGDDAWIAELGKSPAYAGIDVPRQFARMLIWCRENKKQPTRRRFIRWLNKEDKPLAIAAKRQSGGIDPSKIALPSEFREWISGKYPARKAEIEKWKTWADVPAYFREEWKREKIQPLTQLRVVS